MILDTLEHSARYSGLHGKFKSAFDFLKTATSASYPVGTYELEGKELYAMIQEYETKDPDDGAAEAHRSYIDIQYLMHGAERFDAFDIARAVPSVAYDEARDVAFYDDDPNASQCVLNAGDFAVFFPDDVHKPGLACGGIPVKVKKIVVKVKL